MASMCHAGPEMTENGNAFIAGTGSGRPVVSKESVAFPGLRPFPGKKRTLSLLGSALAQGVSAPPAGLLALLS